MDLALLLQIIGVANGAATFTFLTLRVIDRNRNRRRRGLPRISRLRRHRPRAAADRPPKGLRGPITPWRELPFLRRVQTVDAAAIGGADSGNGSAKVDGSWAVRLPEARIARRKDWSLSGNFARSTRFKTRVGARSQPSASAVRSSRRGTARKSGRQTERHAKPDGGRGDPAVAVVGLTGQRVR